MKAILAGSVGLSLSLLLGTARAQESGGPSSPMPSLGRPVIAATSPQPMQVPQLGRPAAVRPSAEVRASFSDSQVRPAAFPAPQRTLLRGQDPEPILHPPSALPIGSNCGDCDAIFPCPTFGCPAACDFDCGYGVHGNAGRFYGRAEYLFWWFKQNSIPPLLTTSNPPQSLGVLGEPGTAVVIGNRDFDSGREDGGRFTLGYWFDCCERLGFEFTYFFLGRHNVDISAASNGVPLLARPFFDITEGAENSQLVANTALPQFPGLIPLTGAINVYERTRFWGIEANLRANLFSGCFHCDWNYHVDLLAGFRHLQFDEALFITENLQVPGTVPNVGGVRFVVQDRFGTHNRFYGGQFGLESELRKGRWFLNARTKLALGWNHQIVNIGGNTFFTAPGQATRASSGGLLALPTNSGRFTRDTFAVVPEVGINLGYQVTDHLRLFVGYTFLYWTNVARPGDEIDRVVNPTQLPRFAGPGGLVGPARPSFRFRDSDFWAQGLNFGLELRY